MNDEKIMAKFARDRFACNTTGIKIEKVSKGYALCSLEIGDKHLNGNDCVMGGAIFTLADYTFGVAANYDEYGGMNTVTLGSTISFVNATAGPMLYAESNCRKTGRSIDFYDITVTDGAGKLIATLCVTGFHKQVD